MLRYILLAILTAMVLIFQNCAGDKNFLDQSPNLNPQKDFVDRVAVAEDLNLTSILTIINVRNTDAMNSTMNPKNLLVRPDVYYYEADRATGIISAFDMNNQKLDDQFCLSSKDISDLTNILRGAQICEPNKNAIPKDQVCTMVYTMPYAKLTLVNNKTFVLGEKNTGCDIPVDLCAGTNTPNVDGYSVALRRYVADLLLNMKTKVCQH